MAVNVIDTLEPKNAGAFPIARADQLLGGFMQVADNTARDAITAARRTAGMRVHVQSSGITYKLAADLTTWIGPGDSPTFKNSVSARSNSGTPTYPSNVAQAVAEKNTFIRTAAADNDSVRMWSAADADYPSFTGGLEGKVTNLTAFLILLYPVSGSRLHQQALLAVNEPIEIPPGVTVYWHTDGSGVTYIS